VAEASERKRCPASSEMMAAAQETEDHELSFVRYPSDRAFSRYDNNNRKSFIGLSRYLRARRSVVMQEVVKGRLSFGLIAVRIAEIIWTKFHHADGWWRLRNARAARDSLKLRYKASRAYFCGLYPIDRNFNMNENNNRKLFSVLSRCLCSCRRVVI